MALFRRRITLICFPAFADAHLCVLTSLDCALIHNTRARLPSIHMALKNSDVVHILEREISVCYDRLETHPRPHGLRQRGAAVLKVTKAGMPDRE